MLEIIGDFLAKVARSFLLNLPKCYQNFSNVPFLENYNCTAGFIDHE